jgi:hypothetical protein
VTLVFHMATIDACRDLFDEYVAAQADEPGKSVFLNAWDCARDHEPGHDALQAILPLLNEIDGLVDNARWVATRDRLRHSAASQAVTALSALLAGVAGFGTWKVMTKMQGRVGAFLLLSWISVGLAEIVEQERRMDSTALARGYHGRRAVIAAIRNWTAFSDAPNLSALVSRTVVNERTNRMSLPTRSALGRASIRDALGPFSAYTSSVVCPEPRLALKTAPDVHAAPGALGLPAFWRFSGRDLLEKGWAGARLSPFMMRAYVAWCCSLGGALALECVLRGASDVLPFEYKTAPDDDLALGLAGALGLIIGTASIVMTGLQLQFEGDVRPGDMFVGRVFDEARTSHGAVVPTQAVEFLLALE